MKKKILISTGGSGGHVIPAISIYEHLNEEYEIIISTDKRGLKYMEKTYCQIFIVDTPKLNKSILLPISILKLFFLILKSVIFLKRKRIQVLISTGGYMSIPLCLAAKILKINIFLFEPNMIVGKANKFFLNFSKKIICYDKNIIGLQDNQKQKIAISNPIIKKSHYQNKNKKEGIFTIMIIGGSQGAKVFDEIMHEIILKISKKKSLKIIHQTSQKNIDFLKKFYTENKVENIVFSFDQKMDILINQSDLCVTRGGASSLAEIAHSNVPFIAIPLPTSKDNHQFENANYYKNKNCCWIIDQVNFDKQKFEELLLNVLKNKDILSQKKKNLENLTYQNTWNNVNQNLKQIINEN